MALARWQASITDAAGNVMPGAAVEVRRESGGAPIAPLYSDRNGATPLGNPFFADAEGFAAFHVAGGSYRITATAGGATRIWRYVAIGLAAESDSLTAGIAWSFDAATADAAPGAGFLRLNAAALASVTQLYLSTTSQLGADVAAWLDTLDDRGGATDRGVITLQAADGAALFVGRVSGAVVAATGYRKLTVTPITASGAFTPGGAVSATFSPSPVNGVNGANGINPGLVFAFSTSTAMAAPGTGQLRLNNAALASVTAAAVDDASALAGNPDVSAAVLSWDDAANSSNRGTLLLKDAGAPSNYALYRISGASVDNAGWTQLALSYVSHAGSFANGAAIVAEFAPAGNAGADGVSSVGKQTIWIPASAMYTSGNPSPGVLNVNGAITPYLAFDPATVEYAFFNIAMPKSWNEGTFTAQFYWAHPATTTNFGVVWNCLAGAYGDNDPIANVYTGNGATDTGGVTSNLYISAETGAIDPGNTQAENDLVVFFVSRNAIESADTLAVDAYLIGVKIFYTTNAATDA